MKQQNPYASSAIENSPRKNERFKSYLDPTTRSMWVAFLVAPIVAPILFAIVFFVFGLVALQMMEDDTGTPIGVIMVPIAALTIGSLIAYLVSALIVMPILFQLRTRKLLNCPNILLVAVFVLAIMVFVGFVVVLFSQVEVPGISALLFRCTLSFAALAPFALVSATTFWIVVRRRSVQRYFKTDCVD